MRVKSFQLRLPILQSLVGFASKVELSKWQRRKLGNRPRRQKGNSDPLATAVLAGDARDSPQQDMNSVGERAFAEDYLQPLKVGDCQRSCQQPQL